MDAVEIKNGLYWVGVKDPGLKVFDIIMTTDKGTTYNSYIIVDEKVTIVDTVKDGFYDDFKSKIVEIIGNRKIDYVVVNHTEPDHSGSLKRLLDDYKDAVVYASKAALLNIKNIINREFNGVEAKDELCLGKRTLKFISAPLLHWPDTIFTYDEYDKVIFTCDAFGCHYCAKSLFNDSENEGFDHEFRYYYDVIMSPFKKNIISAIGKIKDLKFDTIAVSHGPIIRNNVWDYIKKYEKWSSDGIKEISGKQALVLYISAYGYTKSIAEAIAEGVKSTGNKVEIYDITKCDINELVDKLSKAKALAIGSPTINQDAVKPVWDFLSVVSPIANRGKTAVAFGSYGWSGEAVKMIENRLKDLKFKVIEPGLKVCFKPSDEDIKKAHEIGEEIGKVL